MSLLARIPGGLCTEPPVRVTSRSDEDHDALKARLLESLLPAQRDFCEDTSHLILGFCAGFGAGKTAALCAKMTLLAMENPGTVGAIFEPTHIMIRDVWMRSFDDFLERMRIPHDFRVSPQPEYVLHLPRGPVTLLCRATETWNRIRGQNLAFAGIDEIDTSPQDTAQKATEMVLARLRGGTRPQLAVASTPEGYRWMYRTFVQDFYDADAGGDADRVASLERERRLIRAKTTDNPYLPEGFVESLMQNYSAQLVTSYINGEFCNLANTTVYAPFDRDRHWCDTTIRDDDRLLVGLDLNVMASFCEVVVRRGDEFHVVAEHSPKDTPSVVRMLQETYPQHHADGNIVIIPDAAARARTTTNAQESDLAILRRGGFEIKAQASHPAIEDRVNGVNVLLLANRLKVHPKCRYLIRALEQQAYAQDGKPEKGRGGMDDLSGPVDALGYCIHHLAPLRRWATGGSRFRVY